MSQSQDHETIMDTTSGSQHTHHELQHSLVATMWLQVLYLYVCYYILMYNIESDISPIRLPQSENNQDLPPPPHGNTSAGTPVIRQAGMLHVRHALFAQHLHGQFFKLYHYYILEL